MYHTRKSKVFLCLLSMLAFGNLSAQPDISVTTLVSPVSPFCSGTNSVAVMLQNTGPDTVFTAQVNWTVNGLGQAPLLFNDTLAPATMQLVVLGAFFFNRKLTYQLTVVSSDPNGLPDADPSNDSLVTGSFSSMMNGSYSAGIVADYATLTDAVNDLVSRGVCGPVVLNINPGIFSEQLTIPSIQGASAGNTITFQSSTADSTSVVITFPASSNPSGNYTLQLNSADHFIFNQVTLERRGSLPYSRVVELTRNAAHNVFTNCRIAGGQNLANSSQAALVFSDSSSLYRDSSNSFLNTRFLDGAAAIFFEGSGQNSESGMVISGNQFLNQVAGGLLLEDLDAPELTANVFQTTSVDPNYQAIHLDGCMNGTQVFKNLINSPGNGIVISGCKGAASNRILLANNMILSGDSSGMVLDASWYLDAVYNTIQQTSSDPDHTAILVSDPSNTVVKNNILVNNGGGLSYVLEDSLVPSGISESDNNDLYSTGPFCSRFNGTYLATLADWKVATNFDLNSVAADPEFISAQDLHASAYTVDNKGKFIPDVWDDIDGELRSAATPDMGADEFTAIIHDLAVSAVALPANPACENAFTEIQLLIHNIGGYGENGFIIHADISGAGVYQLTDTIFSTVAAGDSDTLAFSQPINTLGGGLFTIQASVSLPGDIEPNNDSLQTVITVFTHFPPASASGVASCGPDTVQLTATGSVALYWFESPAGGNVLDSGSTIQYFAAASDTLYVQNSAICASIRTPVPILVRDLPEVSLGNDTVIVAPQTVTLSADSGYVAYVWNTGDTVPVIVVDSSGLYIVAVTDSNGCVNSDTILVDVLAGIHEMEALHDLQLFPNPAMGNLHVEWKQGGPESGALTIMDLSGRVVFRKNIQTRNGIFKDDLDVRLFASGVYVLQVQSTGGTQSKRFVLH